MKKLHIAKLLFAVLLAVVLTGCKKEADLGQNWSFDESEELDVKEQEGVVQSDSSRTLGNSEESEGLEESGDGQMLIGVYVHGAVHYPGVYYLPEDARVCDAVYAAGGFKKNASRKARNQAEYLSDGEDVFILTKKEYKKMLKREGRVSYEKSGDSPENDTGQKQDAESSSEDGAGLVNINTATKEVMMTLPGIGKMKAEAIISYRMENGNFRAIEDIMLVPGIKEGIFASIKDFITV